MSLAWILSGIAFFRWGALWFCKNPVNMFLVLVEISNFGKKRKKMNFEKHVYFDSSQHQCQASSNMSSTLNLPTGPQISGMSQRSCLLLSLVVVTSRASGWTRPG
jgi:hypothetical protein